MRRLGVAFALVILLVIACGTKVQEAGTGWGASDTNTLLAATVVPSTSEVDICNSISAGAIANITATVINAGLPGNTLYLEQYSVEYTATSAGAPALTGWSFPVTFTLPVTDMSVNFVDSSIKSAYASAIGSANIFTQYTATYTFSGHDKYGSSFGVVASTAFTIGAYSSCATSVPVSISPSSVSVAGIANPDSDATDNVTFYISGGTGPYTVYSGNVAVTAPGALASGVTSFTLDPTSVTSSTVVTITVVDAKGASAQATLALNPGASLGSALSVTPSSVSVVGVANPDADASDDVTFYISGGTGPYTVYSGNVAVTAPGALASGVTSFTLDPASVASSTVVTITVVDAKGASAQSTLVVSAVAASGSALTVTPSSVSVVGIANPDSDASDNVTFYISGGTGPYTVYSGNVAVTAPGALASGVTNFTLDPASVLASTTALITITDAIGASVQTTMVVNAEFSSGSALTVTPSSVAVVGLSNPDADASDDVTFYISGGTGPYIVYSDNVAATVQGALASGVTSFTLDPDSVASDAVVTLTIVDALGASVHATLTIRHGSSAQALSIVPVFVAVVGLSNPDLNSGDDVTFTISDGTAPYTIYSGSSAIASPGVLGSGVMSFTVDPDQVAQTTSVIVTVVDAVGASSISTVVVSP